MFNFRSVFTLTVVVAMAAFAASCNGAANDEIAAKVGSREITLNQVDAMIKQQLDASAGTTAPLEPAELAAARLSVLDNMIQEEALFQKAQKGNLLPDDAKVNQEIQRRKQEATLTEEQYQNQLKQAGMTDEEYREKVRKELAISSLRDREKARVNAPSEDEIRKYYEDRKDQFVAGRGVDLSVIVSDPADNGSGPGEAIGDAAAEAKVRQIYERLKSNADFEDVASEVSEHATRFRGGALGFATEPALKQTFPSLPDLFQRLISLNTGQYTEPIKDSGSGAWLIFKLKSKLEQPRNFTLDDVRKTIIDTLTQQRQQILLNALLVVAMTETTIKNHFAERIVEKPETVVVMRPSALLNQTSGAPQQPQPRIENENKNNNTSGGQPSNSNAGGRQSGGSQANTNSK